MSKKLITAGAGAAEAPGPMPTRLRPGRPSHEVIRKPRLTLQAAIEHLRRLLVALRLGRLLTVSDRLDHRARHRDGDSGGKEPAAVGSGQRSRRPSCTGAVTSSYDSVWITNTWATEADFEAPSKNSVRGSLLIRTFQTVQNPPLQTSGPGDRDRGHHPSPGTLALTDDGVGRGDRR